MATFQSTSRYPRLYLRWCHVHLLQHARSLRLVSSWLGCYNEQSECFVRGYYQYQARLAKDLSAYCGRSIGSELEQRTNKTTRVADTSHKIRSYSRRELSPTKLQAQSRYTKILLKCQMPKKVKTYYITSYNTR